MWSTKIVVKNTKNTNGPKFMDPRLAAVSPYFKESMLHAYVLVIGAYLGLIKKSGRVVISPLILNPVKIVSKLILKDGTITFLIVIAYTSKSCMVPRINMSCPRALVLATYAPILSTSNWPDGAAGAL